MKKLKISIIITAAVLLLAALTFTALGVFMGFGPLHSVRNIVTASFDGNSEEYGFDKIEKLPGNPLEGKNICVLGSSVVYGFSSQECSVAEYFGARFGCTYTK